MLISDDILRWASVSYQLVKYDGETLTVTGSLSKHLQRVAESLNQHFAHHHQIISIGAKGVPLNCKCFLQKCLSNTFYKSCFPYFCVVLHFVLCQYSM